jgi:hypothetical protein
MTTSPTENVPSPADTPLEPEHDAEELLDYISDRGGRIFRLREVSVFCLTQDEELARWLLSKGGKSFSPPHLPRPPGPNHAYRRYTGGPWEWDIYIHIIPVKGERTIWEAAQRFKQGRRDGSN